MTPSLSNDCSAERRFSFAILFHFIFANFGSHFFFSLYYSFISFFKLLFVSNNKKGSKVAAASMAAWSSLLRVIARVCGGW